jgi:hypothetical protein
MAALEPPDRTPSAATEETVRSWMDARTPVSPAAVGPAALVTRTEDRFHSRLDSIRPSDPGPSGRQAAGDTAQQKGADGDSGTERTLQDFERTLLEVLRSAARRQGIDT